MIVCKIGDKTVNCYDGIHSRETLKNWAKKNILLCPVCEKPYEYCHGKIVLPYFRHKDKKACLVKYYEPETDEHIKGKIDLFNWVQTLYGVTDVVLEGWIPETHQRPDIMFKKDGKQCVVEYQCTPISSEYLERTELYRAAGIIDFWILGTENYFNANKSNIRRIIEKECAGYYSISIEKFLPNLTVKKSNLLHKSVYYNLSDISIFENNISISNEYLEKLRKEVRDKIYSIDAHKDNIKQVVNKLNRIYGNNVFKSITNDSKDFYTIYSDYDTSFFIHEYETNYCDSYVWHEKIKAKTKTVWKSRRGYRCLNTLVCNNTEYDKIFDFIVDCCKTNIKLQELPRINQERFSFKHNLMSVYSEYITDDIYLCFSPSHNSDSKWITLENFYLSKHYFLNILPDILKNGYRKFIIPEYRFIPYQIKNDMDEIIPLFSKLGFTIRLEG